MEPSRDVLIERCAKCTYKMCSFSVNFEELISHCVWRVGVDSRLLETVEHGIRLGSIISATIVNHEISSHMLQDSGLYFKATTISDLRSLRCHKAM